MNKDLFKIVVEAMGQKKKTATEGLKVNLVEFKEGENGWQNDVVFISDLQYQVDIVIARDVFIKVFADYIEVSEELGIVII